MSAVYPKYHLSLCKQNSNEEVLYEDTSLRIKIKYDFDMNNNIESILFNVYSKANLYYEVLNINPCYDEYGVNVKAYHVHFKTEKKTNKDTHEFIAVNPEHIPDINLRSNSKRGLAVFRFSFHKSNAYSDPCAIIEHQPETKDGAIIVSI